MSDSFAKNPIEGKRILFFAPTFFGYEEKIKDKMIELGAKVDAFDVRSVTRPIERALLKVNPNIFYKRTEAYYAQIYLSIRKTNYDYVLFVKCDMPTEHILDIYRKRFRNAKFCLYMWDSIKNIPNVEKKFKYFDFISSFDRNDCSKNLLIHFRPLFYCDDYTRKTKEETSYVYDLCFIGTVHSDRWKILKDLKRQAEKQRLRVYYYPYLQSKFIYLFYKLIKREFWNTSMKEFQFCKLSSRESAEKINQSRVIIDIQHPKQTGLTMRTIEIIGMNKKLITTNTDIRKYDFFERENIQIIDRKKPILEKYLEREYKVLDSKIYEKYSLESWIYEVLGI